MTIRKDIFTLNIIVITAAVAITTGVDSGTAINTFIQISSRQISKTGCAAEATS